MRPDNPRSVYLDSTFLITHFAGQTGVEVTREVMRLGERGQLRLWICAVSLVEVRGQSRTAVVDPLVEQDIRATVLGPHLLKVDLHEAVMLRARGYVLQRRMGNYDAIHLAAAVEAGVDVLMTSDKGFPLGQAVDGVWVDEPYIPGDPQIPGLQL